MNRPHILTLLPSTEGSIALSSASQPNIYPFTATVTYAGRLSDYFVGGTDQIDGGPYKVMIPENLLEAKAQELVGRGVFAADDLDSHDDATKVGEFTHAWTQKDDAGVAVLKASGLIYRHKAEKLVDKIIEEARAGRLGFSYDLKSVEFDVRSQKNDSDNSTSEYIELSGFTWRGATILYRQVAAYQSTELAAQRAVKNLNLGKDLDTMDEKQLQEVMAKLLSPIQSSVDSIKDTVGKLTARVDKVEGLQAAASKVAEPKEPKTEVTTAESLGAVIGEAVTKAITPLVDSVKELKAAAPAPKDAADDIKGARKSLQYEAASFIKRFDLQAYFDESDDVSSDTLRSVALQVGRSDKFRKDQKEQALNSLNHLIMTAKRIELRGGAQ